MFSFGHQHAGRWMRFFQGLVLCVEKRGNLDILWLAPCAGQRRKRGPRRARFWRGGGVVYDLWIKGNRISTHDVCLRKGDDLWPTHEQPPIMTRYAAGPTNVGAFPPP